MRSIIQSGFYCYQCGRTRAPLERHPDDIADGELYHLEHLETIIDTAEDIAHELRRYKEDIC